MNDQVLPVELPTIVAGSFRPFDDDVRLTLRPLTLLYGHNQSGKSALLRLLPLLADSLVGGNGPLAINSAALRGASFKELPYRGRGPNNQVRIGLETSEATGASLQLDIDLSSAEPFVNRFSLELCGGADKWYGALVDLPSRGRGEAPTYEGQLGGTPWTGACSFAGLLPKCEGIPEAFSAALAALEVSLAPLRGLQWLQAQRMPLLPAGAKRATKFRSDGSDLADLLHQQRKVLRLASDWLFELTGDRLQTRENSNGQTEFQMVRPSGASVGIEGMGEGIRGLIPVIGAVALAELGTDRPTMLAIEEPEANLHPHFHVAIADKLIAVAAKGLPVVVETHSVYFLLALQKALLEGRIAVEQVGVHWLEQTGVGSPKLKVIQVAPDGTMQGLPVGTFRTDRELTEEIMNLRWTQYDAESAPCS